MRDTVMKLTRENIWDFAAGSYHRVSVISRAHQQKFNKVAAEIILNGNHKILDAGCGSGAFMAYLYKAGYKGEFIGGDSSAEMVKIAKKNNNFIGAKVLMLNLNQKLPYADAFFDGVVSINVLFFLENPQSFISEVRRVLKKDSYFYLVVPKQKGDIASFFKEQLKGGFFTFIREILSNFNNIPAIIKTSKMQRSLDKLHGAGLIHYHSFEEVSELLGDSFNIIKTEEVQARQNWLFVGRAK